MESIFFLKPFCLSKKGEFLLMFRETYMIYNPNNNSIKYSDLKKLNFGLLTDFYIQSLVCPLSQS